MEYRWKSGSMVKADPQTVGDVCAELESRGRLTPSELVNESRPTDAPLHDLFEWDDEIAAERYRETQAAYIIRSVEVVTESPEPVRAFVSVKVDDTRKYIGIGAALSCKETRRSLLQEALADLKAYRRKYAALKALKPVFDAIDGLEVASVYE